MASRHSYLSSSLIPQAAATAAGQLVVASTEGALLATLVPPTAGLKVVAMEAYAKDAALLSFADEAGQPVLMSCRLFSTEDGSPDCVWTTVYAPEGLTPGSLPCALCALRPNQSLVSVHATGETLAWEVAADSQGPWGATRLCPSRHALPVASLCASPHRPILLSAAGPTLRSWHALTGALLHVGRRESRLCGRRR